MTTIYLADRDEAYRTQLAHALRQWGADVVEFASGSELYARTIENDADLVVMETDLDDMDGFQVFVRLQRERPEKRYRIVFLTRFEHPGVAHVCKHHGALDYISKSHSLDEIVARIKSLVGEEYLLYELDLPAALKWLQSWGKSGRLDITAYGESGHVILYRGRVLEARWNFFERDQALQVFMEMPLEARFRFIEWYGETAEGEAEDLRRLPQVSPRDLAAHPHAGSRFGMK